MMQEFAMRLKNATGVQYLWWKQKIKFVVAYNICFQLLIIHSSCLAHVINLATQTLISTYSLAPYFDTKNPDAHVPTNRDEIGIVHTVAVKVYSQGM